MNFKSRRLIFYIAAIFPIDSNPYQILDVVPGSSADIVTIRDENPREAALLSTRPISALQDSLFLFSSGIFETGSDLKITERD